MNTQGAVVGVLVSTFWLLEWLGTRTMLFTACGVILINGLAAWLLSEAEVTSVVGPVASLAEPIQPRGQKAQSKPSRPLSPTWIYLTAASLGAYFF